MRELPRNHLVGAWSRIEDPISIHIPLGLQFRPVAVRVNRRGAVQIHALTDRDGCRGDLDVRLRRPIGARCWYYGRPCCLSVSLRVENGNHVGVRLSRIVVGG